MSPFFLYSLTSFFIEIKDIFFKFYYEENILYPYSII